MRLARLGDVQTQHNVLVHCAIDFQVIRLSTRRCQRAGARRNVARPQIVCQWAVKNLAAEDNVLNQQIIESIVVSFGYSTKIANNDASAIDMQEFRDNDLVLLDIHMSKVSDIDGTRAVCAMDREKPAASVITISTNAIEGRRIG